MTNQYPLRPLTNKESHFYATMMQHYKERMQALPHVYFLRNTYNAYKQIVESQMIWYADTE